jgi:beta-lactamase class C
LGQLGVVVVRSFLTKLSILMAWFSSLLGCAIALARPVDQALDLQRLDAELRGIMLTGQMPALAVGVVADGQVIVTRALGTQVVGGKTTIDANTRFRLASMTKSVSAALVGKLVNQGFLDWETPVTLLVPNFRLRDPNSVFLTVEQLMSQRTGLPHHSLDDEMEAADSFQAVRPLLPSIIPVCAIGSCFAYQNVSYGFAEDISYAASGQFFANALRREIFEPIGMARANVGLEGLSEDDNWARPHERQWPKWKEISVKPNYYWVSAAAGVNASLSDMQQYVIALLGNKPDALSPEVITKLTTPQIATPGEIYGPLWRRARLRSAGYGLGLRIFDYSGHLVWFHAGAVAGYRGMIVGLPEKNAGMVLMWNSESNLPAGLVPTLLDRWLNFPAHDWLELHRYMPKLAPVRRGANARSSP